MVISQKRCKINIQLQWKSNRKLHVSYQMALISMTFTDLECHFLTPIHQWIWHAIYIYIYIGKYLKSWIATVFQKWQTSRLGALQAVTYTVKVVVSKKWREMDTLLLHTTNRKYHMAYLFVPFPMTLDDLECHPPNAGLVKCNSTNICETLSMVLTDTARRAVRRR